MSIVRVHVHIIMSIVQMCECVSCVLLYSDAVLGVVVGVAHICHLVVALSLLSSFSVAGSWI